jgi:arginase
MPFLQAGLADWLREQGHNVGGPFHVKLTPDEEAAYGAWNKIGFANAHLARLISEAAQAQAFPLVLQSNCYGAIGALAGLQMSADPPSPRLGMIWIDAHGDCNTPETTLSGMLSGMPVAIATGLCLDRLCAAMNRLSSTVDLIYVHFDADALDQSEVASMRLTEPNGPMRTELAAALEIIMAYPKIEAFGIADINPEGDVDGQMVRAALAVITGGIAGVAG